MGILDLLGLGDQGGGLFGNLFGQPPKPQYDWMPPQQRPGLFGLGDKRYQLMGGLAGALKPGAGPSDTLMGMISGSQNDIMNATRLDALKQHREQQAAAASLVDKFANMTPEQKRFLATNPKAWEALSTAIANPTTTTIGNTALQGTPGGGVRPVFREPQKPELVEGYDPASQRMTKRYVQPPEPFGGYGVPGNMVVPGKTPGTVGGPGAGGFFSAPSAGEKEEATKIASGLGEDYTAIQKKSSSATSSLSSLQRMSQLSPQAFQGAAAPGLQYARSLLTSFGIPSKTVAAGEELTALSNKLVLDANNGSLGTGVSNADVMFLSNINPNLAQSDIGRKQVIDMLVKVKTRDQEVAKEADDWRKKTGSMAGFQSYIAQWANEHPMFPDVTRTPAAVPSGSAVGKPGEQILGTGRPPVRVEFSRGG